jgi:hypothetical protein
MSAFSGVVVSFVGKALRCAYQMCKNDSYLKNLIQNPNRPEDVS